MERVFSMSANDLLSLQPDDATVPPARGGRLLGTAAQFVSMLGASLTFPFLQTQRDLPECNALC